MAPRDHTISPRLPPQEREQQTPLPGDPDHPPYAGEGSVCPDCGADLEHYAHRINCPQVEEHPFWDVDVEVEDCWTCLGMGTQPGSQRACRDCCGTGREARLTRGEPA